MAAIANHPWLKVFSLGLLDQEIDLLLDLIDCQIHLGCLRPVELVTLRKTLVCECVAVVWATGSDLSHFGMGLAMDTLDQELNHRAVPDQDTKVPLCSWALISSMFPWD